MYNSIGDKFSKRANEIRRSPIRELLKLITKPEIISFAGGIPDPTLFPAYLIEEATKTILREEPEKVLQYGPTEGDIRLKMELIKRQQRRNNIKINEDEILITTASQQALDLMGKIFIDSGDTVIVGLPSYLGGLGAFHSYGAEFIGIPLDEDGMRVDLIEEKLKKLKKEQIKKIKFIYVIPDFQNPAGVTLSLERRKKLIKIAKKHDLLILEDTPYRELRYWNKSIPPIFLLAPRGRVVTLFTFSKVFCPGMRLGYVLGSENVIDRLVVAKQSTDLCTPPFTQGILCEMLKGGALDEHIKKLVSVYREKREYMLNVLNKYMLPLNLPDLNWTRPDGGLFLWMTLPAYMDTELMFPRALEKKIAYVKGCAFHYDNSGKNTMRLNFSYPTMDAIDEGIRRLSQVIAGEIRK